MENGSLKLLECVVKCANFKLITLFIKTTKWTPIYGLIGGGGAWIRSFMYVQNELWHSEIFCPISCSKIQECLRMSKNVRECPRMSKNGWECPIMSKNVQECPKMSENVRECLRMSENVRKCPRMSENVQEWRRSCLHFWPLQAQFVQFVKNRLF